MIAVLVLKVFDWPGEELRGQREREAMVSLSGGDLILLPQEKVFVQRSAPCNN